MSNTAQLNPQTAPGYVVRITGIERESDVMSDILFRFVKQVASLDQKLTDAALMELSDPAGNGFAGWKHAVLLSLREHMSVEYEEIIDWAEEMERVRAVLNSHRGEFPVPSTLCKAFKRASMTSGDSCSAGRRSCWTRMVTPQLMPPTSTANRHRPTTCDGLIVLSKRSRRRFS
mgnify:CR=1 FL=1